MRYKFANAKILSADLFFEGEVWVKDIIIEYVGKKTNKTDFDRIIDVGGNVLMPGLVNTHAHSGLVFGRGSKDDSSLEEWLFDYILPLETKFTQEHYYYGTLQAIKEYVRCGITSCIDMYFSPASQIKAYCNSGFRAKIAVSPKDFVLLPKDTVFDDMFSICVCLHSVYTTDEKEIERVMEYAKKYNLGTNVHLCETLTEVGNCTAKHDMTPIAYLNSFGFFDYPCAAAHCVHLDDNDMDILLRNDVNVCSNPSSNLKLGSGVAPIYTLLKKGISVSVGTDSAASNNTLDIFKEMVLANLLQKGIMHEPKAISSNESIKMATVNGAKALGIEKLGEIKEGYLADIILVNINEPNYAPCNNLAESFVYSVNSKDVYLTMVNGKILYEDGEYYLAEDVKIIDSRVSALNAELK